MQTTQHIEITHNPFTIQTNILVNGEPPGERSPLSSHANERLQRWVEGLFDELSKTFNGAKKFALTFNGVESDWLDIEEAAEKARSKGMEITLEPMPFASSGEQRLKDLMELKNKAGDFLDLEDGDFKRTFAQALDKDFDVFVVATMSSGKSTLLNSILGMDLLPAANAATTATLAEIRCNDRMPDGVFKARCLDSAAEEIDQAERISKELLARWNGDTEGKYKDVFKIVLEGKIEGFQEREHVRLVLTDTPGANNSQSEEHRKTTMKGIQTDGKQPLIVYVLNGTQLATNDDKSLLGLVSEEMAKGGKQNKDRFLFVANKMDNFDPEREKVSDVLKKNVRSYLEENGISNPLVYPVTARLAYLLRKKKAELERSDAERLTYFEQNDLSRLEKSFNVDVKETKDMDMEQYMSLSSRVRKNLEDRKLPPLLRRSGVPALESLIDEYIDKYSFPYRVSRAYAALREAIRKASDKANLEKQLDQDRTELEKIRGAVLDLKARKEKGFDTKAYRDRLKRESKDLPDATRERLLALQQERVPVLRELKNESQGKAEISPSDAEKFLRKAEEQLRFLHLKLLNAYENEFKRAQEEIQADLRKEYKEYVQSLFPESIELKLPVLEGIKNTLSNLSLDLVVRENDIKHIYRTGIYFAGDLYKPWTWLDWRTHTIEDGSKKFVNLGDLWTERENEVERCFQDLVANAQDHIESGHEQLIKEYLAFMAGEFDKHFDNLMADLEAKLSDQKLREVAIANAEKQLGRISSLETELDVVLKV